MNICARPHVLVTGASSGIGRATALRLTAGGHYVYAGVRKQADGAALAQAAAGELTPLLLDVTDAGQITAAANEIAQHVGDAGLAGLVNNAGIGVFGPLELIPIEQFRRQLDVNVTGQLAVTQAFLPLLRQARGRIVMIGSIGTRFTAPFIGPLAASKSTLATLTTALRQELVPWDIRVVLVEPGSIRSEAVGKLDADARQVMSQASPAGQALYQDAFGNLVAFFSALHRKGWPSGGGGQDRTARSDYGTTVAVLSDRQERAQNGADGSAAPGHGTRRATPQARTPAGPGVAMRQQADRSGHFTLNRTAPGAPAGPGGPRSLRRRLPRWRRPP